MNEQMLKVLGRIFNTEDGKEFVDYIIKLKNDNYKSWKQEGGDVLRGKAICYDEIIALFEKADTRIKVINEKPQSEWL